MRSGATAENCLARAHLYARLVTGGIGQTAYNDGQKKACECCTCDGTGELTQVILKAVEFSGT